MATLTASDYKELKNTIYRAGYGKEDLKGLPRLPNRAEHKAAFQAVEDDFISHFATLKGAIETALGQNITNKLAQKYIKTWFDWKSAQLLL